MYFLNPYAQIFEKSDEYIIYSPPDRRTDTKTITIPKKHKAAIDCLIEKESIEEKEVNMVFGENIFEFLVNNNVLIKDKKDIKSIYSRNDMFFRQYTDNVNQSNFTNKRILILGCGGIGSHIAWHMAALGVGNIYLVDYDTVEESNFNRQLLFNQKDVGLLKANVLKEKIKCINPNLCITAINEKINSKKRLEEICLYSKFDLIIKALDSPTEFPYWFDEICKTHKLKYISGITLRDRALIGPTYIPELSEYGWSDIINTDTSMDKIYGTIPSLGIYLYHISSELAQEAFKILVGNNDLKYTGIIKAENLITNEITILKNSKDIYTKEFEFKHITLLNFFSIAGITLYSNNNKLFLLLSFVFTLLLPYISYNKYENILKSTFVNLVFWAFFVFYGLLKHSIQNFYGFEKIMLILNIFILFSALCILGCGINYIICNLIKKIKS